MGKVVILGSAHAVPNENQENTHLFVQAGNRNILIDCASNPFQVLPKNGIPPNCITDIIITHFHPDHVSGLPLLLMDLWLIGRREPLAIYANAHAVSRIEAMMELFDWQKWPNFYPIAFNEIPEKEMHLAIADSDVEVYTSPVQHLIPTIGLRIEFFPQYRVMTYSCDTEPCQAVVRLAKDADVLLHEAAGPLPGHSSAAQAAQIAAEACAEKLMYIHYPAGEELETEMIADGKKFYNAKIELAKDMQSITF
ncbi:MAG: ribonuclease Z [Anaerolineaceae bacterium]|nr:ribonuclease Z [Anaerolineaceae bacterium]